jgi:hydrolase of X-linked nucleoside diphosphate
VGTNRHGRFGGKYVMDPQWLRWVKRLQAIAQDGLTCAADDYDVGRYEQLREIAAEILASRSTGELEDVRTLLELETGPATPKVDVRAAAFDGDRILLVRVLEDGSWSLCPAAGPTWKRHPPRPRCGRYKKSPATGCGRCA